MANEEPLNNCIRTLRESVTRCREVSCAGKATASLLTPLTYIHVGDGDTLGKRDNKAAACDRPALWGRQTGSLSSLHCLDRLTHAGDSAP